MQALHDQYGLCSCKLYMLQINSIRMCMTHNLKDLEQYFQSCHHENIKARFEKSKNNWLASKISSDAEKDLW